MSARLARHVRGWPGLLGIALGLMLISLAVYGGSLGAPLDSDARFLTSQNAFVREAGGIARFWTADFFEGAVTHGVPYISGYYRPVTNVLFWIEFRIAGDQALLYRVTQILIHGLNAFLVFLLCRRLSRDWLVGAVAGLTFLLHPVHAFAASQPAARADVLFAVFYLLAILTFDDALTDHAGRSRSWKLALTVLLYVLAVLSKEMGITLPAVLVLLVLYRRFQDGISLSRLTWTIPVWVTFLGYFIFRFGILRLPPPTIGYGETHPGYALVLGGIKGIIIHISRLFVPLGATYPELNPRLLNQVSSVLTDPLTYVAIIVVGALGVTALLWKWSPIGAFWSGFFLVSFSPLLRVDNIAGTLGTDVILTQERWIYLPAVAAVAVIGLAVAKLARSRPGRAPRLALATGVALGLLLLGRSAAAHAGQHEDPFARLRLLYLLPEERLSRMEQANKLLLYAQWVAVPMGDLADAERRAREAVRLVPDSPISAAALANVLSDAGKWAEVLEALEPWHVPSIDDLMSWAETNPRVGDDLNRVNAAIAYLLGRAHAHLGDGARAMALLCDAVRRGFDRGRVAEVLRETDGLGGGADVVARRCE